MGRKEIDTNAMLLKEIQPLIFVMHMHRRKEETYLPEKLDAPEGAPRGLPLPLAPSGAIPRRVYALTFPPHLLSASKRVRVTNRVTFCQSVLSFLLT